MRRSQPIRRSSRPRGKHVPRDWSEALRKVAAERTCRVDDRAGACAGKVEAAHIIGREHDERPTAGTVTDAPLIVRAIDICPLCVVHHRQYDAHQLDLLPFLSPGEQARAVQVAGGIINALRRISGRETR